jgi:adenine deaminase
MRNLTECGLTLEEVWVAATRGNAASLPLDRLGLIAEGAPADLLVFGEDPTRDLAALATLEAVIADGRFYSRQTLVNAVARHRRKFEGWLYDRITMRLVEAVARPMTDLGNANRTGGSP